jgi:hypothetical protein
MENCYNFPGFPVDSADFIKIYNEISTP